MNMRIKQSVFSILAVSFLLFIFGCENLTPTQNAMLVGGASGAAGSLASVLGVGALGSVAVGAASGMASGYAMGVVAKHEASKKQRLIAAERAKKYSDKMASEKKVGMKKLKTRYIAVDTDKSKESSPQAKKTVMIWDTQSDQIVGNNVYDLKNSPQSGQVGKFDTYNATYIAMSN